jgi:hypothetical protein
VQCSLKVPTRPATAWGKIWSPISGGIQVTVW